MMAASSNSHHMNKEPGPENQVFVDCCPNKMKKNRYVATKNIMSKEVGFEINTLNAKVQR